METGLGIMNQPLKPVEQARVLIDEQLTRAGWFVCIRKDIALIDTRAGSRHAW
jgi:hypothetical protein